MLTNSNSIDWVCIFQYPAASNVRLVVDLQFGQHGVCFVLVLSLLMVLFGLGGVLIKIHTSLVYSSLFLWLVWLAVIRYHGRLLRPYGVDLYDLTAVTLSGCSVYNGSPAVID